MHLPRPAVEFTFAFAIAVLLAGSLPAQDKQQPAEPPQAPPTFPGRVEQVTVDVVVTDKKGVPIRGLTRDDFQVLEDGAAQSVVSFDEIVVPPAPAATPRPRPRVSTNEDARERPGRTFVVLFDDVHLTAGMALQARGAVADFLTHSVREGDRVTLVATLGGTWWTSRMEAGRDELIGLLKLLDGRYIPDSSRERMSDIEAKRIYMDHDIEVAQRVQRRFVELGVAQQQDVNPQQSRLFATSIDPYVTMKATQTYFDLRGRMNQTLALLERALEALNATRGRKSLILVSAGFIWDSNVNGFRRVAEAARRANTAIYFVNAEGLKGLPAELTAQFGGAPPQVDLGFILTDDFWDAEGAETLANDSGGFSVRDTNDLAAGFQRIADENSAYYLLGYNPTNPLRDGAYRKISVQLPGRKGVEIRARKGYYAPSDEEPGRPPSTPSVDRGLQEALDSPYELGSIPLRMTHYVEAETFLGKARVEVVVEVDVRALELEARDGRYYGGVDVLLVTAQRETSEFLRYDQKVELKLLPASRDRLARSWLPIRRAFELKPGGYEAKVVVRDRRTGHVGTLAHRFELGNLSGLRVSTPVLSDSRQEGAATLEEQILPLARRDFEAGGDLYCRFEVYGGQKDGSGMPRVSMGYVMKRKDGGIVRAAEPSEILPTSLGELSRSFHLGLSGIEPGEYDLVMIFYDHVAAKSLQLDEPFTLVAPGSLERAPAAQAGG